MAKQAAEVAVLSGGRLRLGVGVGWNQAEYQALGQPFSNRGARQAEQVELLRRMWTHDSIAFESEHHSIDHAGINPRPRELPPIWFGGSSPAALLRCARIGDGWMPLGGANDATEGIIEQLRVYREAAGLTMDGFGIQAQAQYAGGSPERWSAHARRWDGMGATHLTIATHNAGETDVDGHLARLTEYLAAVRG